MNNPWEKTIRFGGQTRVIQTCGATDRMQMLKTMTVSQLKDVCTWPGTQKTVRAAAAARARHLVEEATKAVLNSQSQILNPQSSIQETTT